MLLSLHRNFVRRIFVYKTSCSDGGIGRHEGLKIPWPLRLCGFKSHSEYQNNTIKALQIKNLRCFFVCFNIFNFLAAMRKKTIKKTPIFGKEILYY